MLPAVRFGCSGRLEPVREAIAGNFCGLSCSSSSSSGDAFLFRVDIPKAVEASGEEPLYPGRGSLEAMVADSEAGQRSANKPQRTRYDHVAATTIHSTSMGEDKHKHSTKRKHRSEHESGSSKKHKRKAKEETKTRIVDDDPNDEDLWVEKNIDMDGERVCSIIFCLLSELLR